MHARQPLCTDSYALCCKKQNILREAVRVLSAPDVRCGAADHSAASRRIWIAAEKKYIETRGIRRTRKSPAPPSAGCVQLDIGGTLDVQPDSGCLPVEIAAAVLVDARAARVCQNAGSLAGMNVSAPD